MHTVPGKTFLVGEYAVLVGGSALGLATNPSFSLTNKNFEYHPQSAAALYSDKNNLKFNQKVKNDYGVGGFGQSTAEFIFAWLKKNTDYDLVKIFNDYLQLFNNDNLKKIRPSGADLVTQVIGKVTYFCSDIAKSKQMVWPFADLSFYIISTGLKIKTHEHLEKLDRTKLAELIPLSDSVIQSFTEKNKMSFIQNLKKWSAILNQFNLIHSKVLDLKNKLEVNDDILLVKPCGALGADVCLVFFDKQKKESVQKFLTHNKIQIQASEDDLCEGVFFQKDVV